MYRGTRSGSGLWPANHDGLNAVGGRDRLAEIRKLTHEVPAQIAILREGHG
jgi:hypothetical protein